MADQTIAYTEEMVGSGHPTKSDTLNRHGLVEHNTDGTHSGVTGIESKLSSTTVSFAADGDTNLYTVPAGKRLVITKAIVIVAGDAGATALDIGQDGAESDFFSSGAGRMDSLGAQYDATVLFSNSQSSTQKQKSYAAGTVIQAKVSSHAGVAGNTIILFGYLY